MAARIKGDNYEDCPFCHKLVSRSYDKAGYTVNCTDSKCRWLGEKFLYEAEKKSDRKNKKYT